VRFAVCEQQSGQWRSDENEHGTHHTSSHVDIAASANKQVAEQRRKMDDIPEDLEALLEVAVCLVGDHHGAEDHLRRTLHADVLGCVLLEEASVVAEKLQEAVNKGFLCQSSDETESYEFVSREMSEKVRKTLFPDQSATDATHQKIGRRIFRSGLDDALALQQFQMSEQSLVKLASEETLYRLAETCLQVGTESARSSEFPKAVATFQFGIRLLPARHWRDHYDLSLNLHQALAETSHVCSNYDQAMVAIECVKANSQDFRDTVTVLSLELYILGVQGKRKQAIDIGVSALQKLGLAIKSNPSNFDVLQTIVQSRLLERKYSPEMILRLPEMTDEKAIYSVKLLNLMFPLAFSTQPKLMPIVTFLMVKLVCKYGLGVMAPVAFGMNGMLRGSLGDTASSLRNAQLALELFERYPSREWLPRVYASVHGGVYACTQPPATTLEPLRRATQVGTETGDTEVGSPSACVLWSNCCYNACSSYIDFLLFHTQFAFVNGLAYAYSLFASGKPLSDLEIHLIRVYKTVTKKKEMWNRFFAAAFLQFVQNLTGKAGGNPALLVGEYFDEENIDSELLDHSAKLVWPTYCMFVSFLFGDLERAAAAAKQCRGVERFPSGHAFLTYASLFQGLSATAFALESGRGRMRAARLAKHCCRVLKRRACILPCVGSSKYSLLKAEISWLEGKHNIVYLNYSQAIASSSYNGLAFDLALSHERLGRYLLNKSDDLNPALSHLRKAQEAYAKWGAIAKAEQLATELLQKDTRQHL